MGKSHAASGVAGWVSLCAAAAALGHQPRVSTVLIGAGVSAGFGLLPDIDHPGSTISRSLGPLTRGIARLVSFVADWVQDRTCPCCKDPDTAAHRGLSHTAVGALAAGALVALCGWRLGQPAALLVVFLAVALAVRGMVSPRARGTLGAALAGAVAAGLVYGLGPEAGWWWLGLPAGFGVLAHIAGDGATKSAVPLLWPLKISGCRWYPCGSPRWLRFRTGGGVERWVVGPLMLAVFAGSCWVLAGMPS
jgi:membrane-bound metal-dependent hydrolase YbcI (DUF457 family)